MLVQWMATLRCGLRCEHCLAVSREAGFSDMPFEKVRGLIDEVASMGVRELLVTGGEPLAREDLGEVIEYLGRKGISWTLNTAAMPGKGLREAIEQNRPGFVAVSLDGPKAVHDAFRGRDGAWDEAMEAIRFFKSLGTVRVCAGTTVTSRNYDYLDETFHLATGSGADQWGIHLLVPEGRAGDRPDLFLSKTQLKRLIKFVAHKRRYFPVQMADEIGYLGYLEPLVRDVPLNCGAGRAQCVVLPDGEVVPCTTLDRSCSAGNVHERSFGAIWAEGFADLRAWRPRGKCGGCDYAVACKGGCWLQRKAGAHCFKEVWHVPGALKTAAGIAICLGGLAAGQDAQASDPAEEAAERSVPAVRSVGSPSIAIAQSSALDAAIDDWYFKQSAGLKWPLPSAGVDWSEPGWKFLKDFTGGALPSDPAGRCVAVLNALETKNPSLSLIALLWRAVNGPLFEVSNTAVYTQAERLVIRDTLAAIERKAREWRLEIFERNLEPYLVRGRQVYSFVGTKAGPRPGDEEKHNLSMDLCRERWGVGTTPDSREAARAYLQEHEYAEQMDLVFYFAKNGEFTRYSADGNEIVASHVDNKATGWHRLGVFDVIRTEGDVTLSFTIQGALQVVPSYWVRQDENLLNDQAREQDMSKTIQITLAGGREYTYVELLNAIHQTPRNTLIAIAYDWLSANKLSLWRNPDSGVVVTVYANGSLLWPAFREILESDTVIATSISRGDIDPRETSLTADIEQIHRRAVLKDIDFWMF